MPLKYSWGKDRPQEQSHFWGLLLAALGYICTLMMVVGILVLQTMTHMGITQAMGTTTLPGSLSPRVLHSRVVGETTGEQRITLSIGLHPRNEAELNRYIQDIMQPRSINFHRFLAPAQFNATFAPSASDYQAIIQDLQAAGFTIVHTYNHRLLIRAKGGAFTLPP